MGSVNSKLHQRLRALKNQGERTLFLLVLHTKPDFLCLWGGACGRICSQEAGLQPPSCPSSSAQNDPSALIVFDAEPVSSLPAVKGKELPQSCCLPCCRLPPALLLLSAGRKFKIAELHFLLHLGMVRIPLPLLLCLL